MPLRFLGGPSRSEITNVLVRDSLWDDIFYKSLQFQHLGGFITHLLVGGAVTVTSGILNADSGIVINGLAEAILSYGGYIEPYAYSVLSWDKPRRFRADMSFVDNTNQVIYFGTGDPRTNLRFMGFKVVNNQVFGCLVDNAGVEHLTAALGVIDIVNPWVFEFRYTLVPNQIVFYINNVLVGTLTAGFPTGQTASTFIFFLNITNTAAGAKAVATDYWEVYQAR